MITSEDIQIDPHLITNFSNGNFNIYEIIKKSHEKNIVIGVADSTSTMKNIKNIRNYSEYIKKIANSLKTKVYVGLELLITQSPISDNLNINLNKIKGNLDYVILSINEELLNNDNIINRIIVAIKLLQQSCLGLPIIISNIDQCSFQKVDWLHLQKFVLANSDICNIVFELNNTHFLNYENLLKDLQSGIKFVIAGGSHTNLFEFDNCVNVINEFELQKEQLILNEQDFKIDFLREK